MKNDTPITKVFKVFAMAAAICIAATLGGLFVLLDSNEATEEVKLQSQTNGRILEIIIAVTGCSAQESLDACRDKLRAGSMAEGARRIIEVDCVTRRAVAGLPAPDSGRSCVEQTPPEVYPAR